VWTVGVQGREVVRRRKDGGEKFSEGMKAINSHCLTVLNSQVSVMDIMKGKRSGGRGRREC
jgi:hypothetical protein